MMSLVNRQSSWLDTVDFFGLDVSRKLDINHRSDLGQFMTPQGVARLMAQMFSTLPSNINLLDAGAGVGALTAAFVAEACRRSPRPQTIVVDAYEIEPIFHECLQTTLQMCTKHCMECGISFSFTIHRKDFIETTISQMQNGLFVNEVKKFNCAILNPPYKKIPNTSLTKKALQSIGMDATNLYTAFLLLAMDSLIAGGELVAITPRSFCNGPYFKSFRRIFLKAMALDHVHVFDSRKDAFKNDSVLQENIIFHATKCPQKSDLVTISASMDASDISTQRQVPYSEMVKPNDEEMFLHIVSDKTGSALANHMGKLETTLAELGLAVSTGRVVDFRIQKHLKMHSDRNVVPLIYPANFNNGYVRWPLSKSRKPDAISVTADTGELLLPSDTYVLVKRFSPKEEPRRVVAAIYDPHLIKTTKVGFENHLNYYHRMGQGLHLDLAKGLTTFLNSTIVDAYVRQFNGHTQVNATDLRNLKYPTQKQLESIGSKVSTTFPTQDEIDKLVEKELFSMTPNEKSGNPIRTKKRITEALAILKLLELPREQQNERSALTLLALLDIKPQTAWAKASNPLRGITEMMDFFKEFYGKEYAPNTRETVRRFTVHQFLQAGIVRINPDNPARATNSPKSVYQIEQSILGILRNYGTHQWATYLAEYLVGKKTLQQQYAQERSMEKIPIQVKSGQTIQLSPGGQNVLIKAIIDELCPRFVPKGQLIYVGDTGKKWAYFDKNALTALGITVDEHGKMPDVVVYHKAENWLLLIEAVTSHGPMNPKRRKELGNLFDKSTAGLVYVTAFLTRKAMVKYLNDISWETEVWVAESPSHMIHFNGERFLGPY